MAGKMEAQYTKYPAEEIPPPPSSCPSKPLPDYTTVCLQVHYVPQALFAFLDLSKSHKTQSS